MKGGQQRPGSWGSRGEQEPVKIEDGAVHVTFWYSARVFRAQIWWDLKVQCLLLGSAYTARRGLGSQHRVLGAPPRHPFFQ